MITQLTGTVTELLEDRVTVTVGGIGYEVLIPLGSRPALAPRLNVPETVLYTIQYLEGTPGKGNLTPRLVGFVSKTEREFFELFTTVDGIGTRKALKALSAPVGEIAMAIERKDAGRLAELPEIGKRTAEKIVAALNGKLERFAWPDGGSAPPERGKAREPLPRFKADALDVLLQLGEKPSEAEDLIARAAKARPEIDTADALLKEVYKIKAGRK